MEAATTFFPRLPFGVKSRTFAPRARKRLYTAPREHRHRFARSRIEKYSCRNALRASLSRAAFTGIPKSAAISSIVSAVVAFVSGLCVSVCAAVVTLCRAGTPFVSRYQKGASLPSGAFELFRLSVGHSPRDRVYRASGRRRFVESLLRAIHL